MAEFVFDIMMKIIENVGLIERWYLLKDMYQFKTIDCMVMNLYLKENMQLVHSLPLKVIHTPWRNETENH